MALIRKFEIATEKTGRPQGKSGAVYPVASDGETFIQIKTFGSLDRAVVSESMAI